MKFTVSTKPLVDSISLGVINQNISNFNQKSCLAQITANRTSLTINLETDSVVTELRLKGSGDGDTENVIFVNCATLKQLVNTFDANVTELEFTDTGLILRNGKSKFILEKMMDIESISLNKPKFNNDGNSVSIDKDSWKFVKDHQMFAISIAYIHPVFTHVYINDQGDIIVGDFDNSIFTHSKKNKLPVTCLLTDTIVNLFNILPDGATVLANNDTYIVYADTDSYEYCSEFTPHYESDPKYGSYNSNMILSLMRISENDIVVDKSIISKSLIQSDLLSNPNDSTVDMNVESGVLSIVNRQVNCKVAIQGNTDMTFSIKLKLDQLRQVISNLDSDKIHINPIYNGEDLNGIVLYTDDMEIMIAGVE